MPAVCRRSPVTLEDVDGAPNAAGPSPDMDCRRGHMLEVWVRKRCIFRIIDKPVIRPATIWTLADPSKWRRAIKNAKEISSLLGYLGEPQSLALLETSFSAIVS